LFRYTVLSTTFVIAFSTAFLYAGTPTSFTQATGQGGTIQGVVTDP